MQSINAWSVCWSIFKKQALRRNNHKFLLGFLAVTDFLMGAVAQPLYIASRICRVIPDCDPCIPDILTDFFLSFLWRIYYVFSFRTEFPFLWSDCCQYKQSPRNNNNSTKAEHETHWQLLHLNTFCSSLHQTLPNSA